MHFHTKSIGDLAIRWRMQERRDKRTSGFEKDGNNWRAILFYLHLKIANFIVAMHCSAWQTVNRFSKLPEIKQLLGTVSTLSSLDKDGQSWTVQYWEMSR